MKAARFRQRRTNGALVRVGATGRGDRGGRLTMTASGRLPGGRIVRDVLTHSLRGRRTARSIRRGLEGGGGHGSKHEVREADTMEGPQPCAVQQAGCGPTLPPKAGSRALRREFVERPVCPASLGGWGDWRSGGVVPATQAVNVSSDCRPRQVLDAFTVQGGDTKRKESRAVSPPRSGGEAGMGSPPWRISFFERGCLGEGGSKGGEPRRGKQHEPAPPAAFPIEMREHSLWALRVGGATRVRGA